MIRPIATAVALAVPAAAGAQAYQCAAPARLPVPRADGPSTREPKRVLPIGSYTLALTWAPQYCRENGDRESAAFQCGSGNRFGFTLHGLWPDGPGKTWPQYCAPSPILSPAVLRANLCATPSVQLLQHEYAKHGTCMNVSPERYFAQATRLYGRLRYPDMDALSRRSRLTAGALASAIARANPGVAPDMMRITADRQGWLDEVWLCLNTRLAYARCPAHQGGLAASAPVRIWRGRR
ncbi:ribonuclease T2 [Sphingomonas guangdongensis]|uniref:Ribonuclease T2 n=1 Tax=Sphingomonas guangdongensis TaxID=1141890 RepID=A0A285R4T9_9SPHN|nr:ribonuclease T2 [Sphingomonas guangdongensis]